MADSLVGERLYAGPRVDKAGNLRQPSMSVDVIAMLCCVGRSATPSQAPPDQATFNDQPRGGPSEPAKLPSACGDACKALLGCRLPLQPFASRTPHALSACPAGRHSGLFALLRDAMPSLDCRAPLRCHWRCSFEHQKENEGSACACDDVANRLHGFCQSARVSARHVQRSAARRPIGSPRRCQALVEATASSASVSGISRTSSEPSTGSAPGHWARATSTGIA